MGTKYTGNSASGYNATPPADDGSVSEANKVKWSTIKTKLADPTKTLAEAIDSDLTTHFDHGPTALTSNTTLDSSHYEKFIQVSGSGVTLSLTDAATLGAGWNCEIYNTDTNTTTISRATGGDTINGTAANYTLPARSGIKVFVNAAANGFEVRQLLNPLGDNTVTSTDAGATAGPYLNLDRNSATPAASDVLAATAYKGRDSGGGTDTYAQVQGEIVDPTATSEDGKLAIQTAVAGTLATRAYVAQGLVVGSPTGADKGTGSVNASTYYKSNIALAVTADVQDFTSTGAGTWTKPTGYDASSPVFVQIWSAGGSGGFRTGAADATGGAGGAYRELWLKLSDLASTETPTVGAGGAAKSGSNLNGDAGGNSTFTVNGTTITVTGGAGGGNFSNLSTQAGPNGGNSLSITGFTAYDGGVGATGAGGHSIYGGGAGGGTNGGVPGAGGNSIYGGGGGGVAGTSSAISAGGTSERAGAGGTGATGTGTGGNGTTPGGGGGGARSGCTASGAGGNGKIRVTVFAVNS